MAKADKFVVKLTGDFYDAAGKPKFQQMGLEVFDETAHLELSRFDDHRGEIESDQIGGAQGGIVLTPAVTVKSVADPDDLIAFGRWGVGFETVDVAACTKAGVLAFTVPGAVDHSVGEVTVMFMLNLTHHGRSKDAMVREGRWDDRNDYMGSELRERTFGAVGLGGIARATIELLSSFKMNPPIAFDPIVDAATAKDLGVKLVSLDELMAEADFVSVHCPMTDQTRGMIGAKEIAKMKPTAYIINTARGGIVDEDAMYDALKEKRIAGAGLDCFVGEPLTEPHRFGELENTFLAPHASAWTHELWRDIGRTVSGGMYQLSLGEKPRGILNPELFDQPEFVEKWKRHQHQ